MNTDPITNHPVDCELTVENKSVFRPLDKQQLHDVNPVRVCKVVPDQSSDKTARLATSGKIKSRSLAIFATGDALRVVTVNIWNNYYSALQKNIFRPTGDCQ